MNSTLSLRHGRWFARLLIFTAMLVSSPAMQAVEFERVLTFATADSVRIEVAPPAGAGFGGEVEFRATITHAGNGRLLWQGPLTQPASTAALGAPITRMISGLKPELWSPDSPVLYNLQIIATKGDKPVAAGTVRIGFRSFEIRDGQFHLNGRPVFLRGIAINPPGRTIPPATGESSPDNS